LSKKKETKKRKKADYVFVVGKRKTAVARAKVVKGTGRIIINSKPLEVWGTEVSRMFIKEPLILAGDWANKLDFYVNVRGGGAFGQAEAIRMAIAKGIIEFSKDEKIKQTFLEYDRNLLVYDPRRTEPHKAKGASKRGARKHKQRSKR